MDYDDLLYYLDKLLGLPIGQSLSSQYDYIMVDEYQDTNRLQASIVQKLASVHKNIMVVGDDAQSIYSFRGAHVHNILDFPQLFPDTTIIKLEQNYRSSPAILDMTNSVIAQAPNQYNKALFSDKKSGEKPVYIEAFSDNEQSQFIVPQSYVQLNGV